MDNIREIHVEGRRVESGPIRFIVDGRPDWKSLNLRGDNAIAASMYWKIIKEGLNKQQKEEFYAYIAYLDSVFSYDIIE